MENVNLKADIDVALADISKLPTLPGVAQKAIALARDPEVDFHKLAEEISKDPSVTASVIRMSNSAFFRPSRKIRSVHEAVVTLGLKTVKDIIVIAAAEGILNVPLESYRLDGNALWEHSLLVAEIAAEISRMKRTSTPPDVAFTAGILHDVGKVVMVHFFKRVYRYIAFDLENNPQAKFTDLERKYLGYAHNEIGARVLSNWQIPEELTEAVLFQYQPAEAKINPELCSIIHLANIVALSAGVGVDIGGMKEELAGFALTRIGMTDDDMRTIYAAVPDMLEQMRDLHVG